MTPSQRDKERARELAEAYYGITFDRPTDLEDIAAQALADVRAEEREAILQIVETEADVLQGYGVPYAGKAICARIQARTEPISSEEKA